jgi:hypothetical protein
MPGPGVELIGDEAIADAPHRVTERFCELAGSCSGC